MFLLYERGSPSSPSPNCLLLIILKRVCECRCRCCCLLPLSRGVADSTHLTEGGVGGSPEDVDASSQVGESRRRRWRRDQVVGVTAIPLIDVLLTGGVDRDVTLVVRLLL